VIFLFLKGGGASSTWGKTPTITESDKQEIILKDMLDQQVWLSVKIPVSPSTLDLPIFKVKFALVVV
jgi:hypothetical protein